LSHISPVIWGGESFSFSNICKTYT
jgi:hypothetical protein